MSDCFKGASESWELNKQMGLEKSQYQFSFTHQGLGKPVQGVAIVAGETTRGQAILERRLPPGPESMGSDNLLKLIEEPGVVYIPTQASSEVSRIVDDIVDRSLRLESAENTNSVGPKNSNNSSCSQYSLSLIQESGEQWVPEDQLQLYDESENVFTRAISMLPQISDGCLEDRRRCYSLNSKISTISKTSNQRSDTERVLHEPTKKVQSERNVEDGERIHFTVNEFLSFFTTPVDSRPDTLIKSQINKSESKGINAICHPGPPNILQEKSKEPYQNQIKSISSIEASFTEEREHGYLGQNYEIYRARYGLLSPDKNKVDPPRTNHTNYRESHEEERRKNVRSSTTNLNNIGLAHQISSNTYDLRPNNETVFKTPANNKKQVDIKTAPFLCKGRNLTPTQRTPIRSDLISAKADQMIFKNPVQENNIHQTNSLHQPFTRIHQSSFGVEHSRLSIMKFIKGQPTEVYPSYENGSYQLFPTNTHALSHPSNIHQPLHIRHNSSGGSYEMFQQNSPAVIKTSVNISHQPPQSLASQRPYGSSAYRICDRYFFGKNCALKNCMHPIHDLSCGRRQPWCAFPTSQLFQDLTLSQPAYNTRISTRHSHLLYITQGLESRILFRVVDPRALDGPILRNGGSVHRLPPTPPTTILCLPHQHHELRTFLEQHALDNQLFSVGLYNGQAGYEHEWREFARNLWENINGIWCTRAIRSLSTISSSDINSTSQELHCVIMRAEFSQVSRVAHTRPGLDPWLLRLVMLVYDALSLSPWTPENRVTPLLVAVFMMNHQLVRYLLLEGADPDGGLLFGTTALGLAMAAKRIDIAVLLTRAGSDVGRTDGRGRRALDYLLAPAPAPAHGQPPLPVLHFYFWNEASLQM